MGNISPSPPPHPPPPPRAQVSLSLSTKLGVAWSHSWESETEEHPSKTTIMIGLSNEKNYKKQQILRKAKKRKSQDFIVWSSIARKSCSPRLFLNAIWISKRCSIIFVKKCLARSVPMYLPIQNIYHAYTVSVCTA